MNREQYISILELEKAELQKERDLYKSIIDELEKYLCQEINNQFSKYFENDEYIRVVNKIRELKGGKKYKC